MDRDIENAIEDFKQIRNINKEFKRQVFDDDAMKHLDMAIEALKKQLNGDWIPVNKRLPTSEEYNKNDGRVIVTDGNRVYQSLFDFYYKRFVEITYKGNCKFDEIIDKRVIAWQALPETYKENDTNE